MRRRASWGDGALGVLDRELARRAELATLVSTPGRRLTFRVFGALRLRALLDEALVEAEGEDAETLLDELAARPELRRKVDEELRALAESVAADPRFAGEPPDDAERRARFRSLVREAASG